MLRLTIRFRNHSLLHQHKWHDLQRKSIHCPRQTGLSSLKSYCTLSLRSWRTVSMLFMLGLFATRGDPAFHFLLPWYAQVILFRRSPSSLVKAKASAPSRSFLCFSLESELLLLLLRCLLSFVGGINQDKSEDHMEPPSSLQCSVKVKIPGSDQTLMNILDCQYRMIGLDPNSLATSFRGVAFLPLNKEGGGGEFVVLIGYSRDLLVLRSAEMKWMRLEKTSIADCKNKVTFRGRFYAVFINGDIFVIDPYSLEATLLMPSERLTSHNYLVPSGNDELFLVERIIVRGSVLEFSKLVCRVSRLDEEAGKWVVVTDLGDRVLLIAQPVNSSCPAKELPDGCGVSGNSMLFIKEIAGVTYSYKYGVDTGNPEDDLNFWRSSRETRLTTHPGPMVRVSPS